MRLEGVQCDVCGHLQVKLLIDGRWMKPIRTLSEQETDSDTGKVETIEPGLDFVVYPPSVLGSLPLEDALSNGGNGGVVPALDVLQKFCELDVVIPDFRWPNDTRSLGVISGKYVANVQANKQNKLPLLDWNPHLSAPGVTQTSIERRVWHRLRKVS